VFSRCHLNSSHNGSEAGGATRLNLAQLNSSRLSFSPYRSPKKWLQDDDHNADVAAAVDHPHDGDGADVDALKANVTLG